MPPLGAYKRYVTKRWESAMKSIPERILLACLLSGLAATAIAQTAVSAQPEPTDLRAADAANDVYSHSLCVQDTGSRIRRARPAPSNTTRPVDCATSSPGRTYSRRDVERTGALDMAQALRELDPSIH
jgi:hypothetical protein